MIFSELYGAYYNTVAAVLRKAVQRPLTKEDLRTVIERCAFSESVLSIEPALTSEKWQPLRPDGTTPLLHPPTGMRTATHLKMRYTYKSSIGYWTRSKSGIRSVLM